MYEREISKKIRQSFEKHLASETRKSRVKDPAITTTTTATTTSFLSIVQLYIFLVLYSSNFATPQKSTTPNIQRQCKHHPRCSVNPRASPLCLAGGPLAQRASSTPRRLDPTSLTPPHVYEHNSVLSLLTIANLARHPSSRPASRVLFVCQRRPRPKPRQKAQKLPFHDSSETQMHRARALQDQEADTVSTMLANPVVIGRQSAAASAQHAGIARISKSTATMPMERETV